MFYNVLVYTPYEGADHYLADANEKELKNFLLGYKGWLDDLTIIGDRILDTDQVLKDLGLVRYMGRVKI